MNRRLSLSLPLAALGLLGGAGGAQAATGAETIHITFQGSNPTSGPAVASGLVTAVGTDATVASTANPDGTVTGIDVITLPRGTIILADTTDTSSFTVNPRTCVGTITGAGHYTIVGGTGDYRAASGQGTFTQRATVLFRRAPTGCTSSVMTLVGTTTLTGLLSI